MQKHPDNQFQKQILTRFWRSFLLICLGQLLYGNYQSKAQDAVTIPAGVSVRINGGAAIVLNNLSLTNNGNIQQAVGDGIISFTGDADASISGSGTIQLDRLFVNKVSGYKLMLRSPISVAGKIEFVSGLLDLGNYIIDLGSTGFLANESENSRAFTDGSGYMQANSLLNIPVQNNPGNLGAVISSSKNMGNVIIKRGHLSPANVSGTNPGIKRYYDIQPAINKSLKASLRLYYFDAELNGLNENFLELWKEGKKIWSRVGFSNRSSATNYVEQTGIVDMAKWTLSVNKQASTSLAARPGGEEILEKEVFALWPNPVINIATIRITGIESTNAKLQLRDINGRLIETRQLRISKGMNTVPLSMKNMGSGVYTLIITLGKDQKIIRIVKL